MNTAYIVGVRSEIEGEVFHAIGEFETDDGWAVTMKLTSEEDRWVISGWAISPLGEVPTGGMAHAWEKSLPWEAIRRATQIAGSKLFAQLALPTIRPEGTMIPSSDLAVELEERARSLRQAKTDRGPQRIDRDELAKVARVYEKAIAEGAPATESVREALHYENGVVAGNRVRQARAAGLIDPEVDRLTRRKRALRTVTTKEKSRHSP